MDSLSAVAASMEQFLALGTSIISWCCTTFPVNIVVAGGVLRIVMGVVRKAKKTVA